MRTSNENTTNRVNQNEQNFQQNISFTEDLDNSLNDFTGKSYLKAFSNEIESFEQHYIGPFNAKCEFCNSKF
jgi:hypothetical protein